MGYALHAFMHQLACLCKLSLQGLPCLCRYASLLVWQQGGWQAQAKPLTWYIVQLVLNLSWPLTFFKAKRLQLAGFVNLGACTQTAAQQAWYMLPSPSPPLLPASLYAPANHPDAVKQQ